MGLYIREQFACNSEHQISKCICSEHYHCYSFVTSIAFNMWNVIGACIPIYKSHKILTLYNLSNRSCEGALHFCKSGKLKHKTTFSCWEKILPSMFIVVVLMVISIHNKLAGNQEVVRRMMMSHLLN